MKHKWYNEIVAWASGADIEYYDSGVNDWRNKTFPDWFENYQYRIKPQPKEPQYLYVYARVGATQVELHRGYKERLISELDGRRYLGKIKLEVDDE